ncbi:MAG: CPBP family intramembrane glutamic endopeptidase, partial [Cyanobacteria bacterium P01_H01_bin.58]
MAVWSSIWGAIAFPLFRKFQWRPFQVISPDKKLLLLLPLYAIAPFLIWQALRLKEQSWQTIGWMFTGASMRSLLLGLAIAVVGLLLLLLTKRALNLITLHEPTELLSEESNSGSSSQQKLAVIAGLLLIGLAIGGVEELVFRGWIQTQLENAFAPWIAATLGSGLFAIVHLIWDGKAGLSQQPGLFLLGWVLVIARWAGGGNIALAWGLHAGWVWGLAYMDEFLSPRPVAEKPHWLTGQAEQPLTSIFDLALLAMTAGLIRWGGYLL